MASASRVGGRREKYSLRNVDPGQWFSRSRLLIESSWRWKIHTLQGPALTCWEGGRALVVLEPLTLVRTQNGEDGLKIWKSTDAAPQQWSKCWDFILNNSLTGNGICWREEQSHVGSWGSRSCGLAGILIQRSSPGIELDRKISLLIGDSLEKEALLLNAFLKKLPFPTPLMAKSRQEGD